MKFGKISFRSMWNRKIRLFACFVMMASFLGTSHLLQAQPIFTDTLTNVRMRDADEWTNMFLRDGDWFGADGIFSFSLDGSEARGAGKNGTTLLTFSDTMTGQVVGDTVHNFRMVNNSVALIQGITPSEQTMDILLNRDENGEIINFFNPETPNSEPDQYYWMGDGFINKEDGNSLNIFGYRVIDHSEKSWDFEQVGVTLITVPGNNLEPPFEKQEQVDAPLYVDIPDIGKGTFGSAVFVNTKWAGAPNPDGFIYVYGLIDPNKKLVVARVQPATFKDFNTWSFWDGSHWQADINKVKPITNRVSNELSLTPLKDGRYLLLFQVDGIGEYTATRIAKSPIGPFGPIQKIRKVPEIPNPPGIIPYNAKIHPVLSTENELLVSYNTISLDYYNDILNYPHMYRPRFFWLSFDE